MSAKKPAARGKSSSKPFENNLPRKILYPSPALKQLLGKVFDELGDATDLVAHKKRREDFIFHMTDWLNDLEDLGVIYKCPENRNRKETAIKIASILYHVIPH